MKIETLANRYLNAWNQRDVDCVLALMHEGAAYYDAYWRESCVGRDLHQYLRDSFEDYTFLYRHRGDMIVTDTGVVLRYSAYEKSMSKGDKAIFDGVEVLTVEDGKILTVSDHYCDPRRDSLVILAELAATRHGETRYAKSGLASSKFLQVKRQLSSLMNNDELHLSSMLTPSRLAEQIGCSIDQLFQVMNVETRVDFHNYLDRHRASSARDLLQSGTNNEITRRKL